MKLPINKLSKNFTLVVSFHETNEWKIRKWISAKLIVLAAWVLGCGIQFNQEDK